MKWIWIKEKSNTEYEEGNKRWFVILTEWPRKARDTGTGCLLHKSFCRKEHTVQASKEHEDDNAEMDISAKAYKLREWLSS